MGQGQAFQGLLAPGRGWRRTGSANGAVQAWAVFSCPCGSGRRHGSRRAVVRQRLGRRGAQPRRRSGRQIRPPPSAASSSSSITPSRACRAMRRCGSRVSVPSASSCWMDCCSASSAAMRSAAAPARAAPCSSASWGGGLVRLWPPRCRPCLLWQVLPWLRAVCCADRARTHCQRLLQPVFHAAFKFVPTPSPCRQWCW